MSEENQDSQEPSEELKLMSQLHTANADLLGFILELSTRVDALEAELFREVGEGKHAEDGNNPRKSG